jgi:HD-GYP domain-containing protein (c-di-GMP phosphodiesterase class II)
MRAEAGKAAANLNGLVDVGLLLEKLLTNARRLVRAEAGTVYLVENGQLRFVTSQNDYLQRLIISCQELPFLGSNVQIDRSTLAGYCAFEKTALTVNDTNDIDPNLPYQHSKFIDNFSNYDCRTIMSMPLISMNGDLLGVLQIINPLDEGGRIIDFVKEDEEVLSFFAANAAMAMEKALMLRRMTLLSVRLVSGNDPSETTGHALRVSRLSTELYSHWSLKNKLPESEREYILNILPLAAMLHDVGLRYIPREIMVKPGRLEPAERTLMESHVVAGARLFSKPKTSLDRLILSIIIDHHERWDGRGYPGGNQEMPVIPDVIYGTIAPPSQAVSPLRNRGKKGEEISIYGRILAVADVYDALSSPRLYKESFDESLAVQIMEQESGHHFDPQVIDSFMAIRPQLKKIRLNYPDNEIFSELD